jgi:hypothetical protein
MLDFETRLQNIGQQTVLCVGDLMLDDFVYGEVGRISPEAPAPVLAVKRNELAIGGAGNVARNVASLGARCIFVGLVGADDAARDVIARLQADPLIEPSLVIDPTRPTTRKGPLRLGAFFHPSAARRLGAGGPGERCPGGRHHRARARRAAAGRRRSCSRTKPRACSRRASSERDRARRTRRAFRWSSIRRRPTTRSTAARGDHPEPPGTCRSDAASTRSAMPRSSEARRSLPVSSHAKPSW